MDLRDAIEHLSGRDRAARRVERNLDHLHHPDDERQHAIARDALAAGGDRYEILPL